VEILYFTRTSQDDYEQLLSLDVLEIQDGLEGNPDAILTEYQLP
jgi:hypothetical protein